MTLLQQLGHLQPAPIQVAGLLANASLLEANRRPPHEPGARQVWRLAWAEQVVAARAQDRSPGKTNKRAERQAWPPVPEESLQLDEGELNLGQAQPQQPNQHPQRPAIFANQYLASQSRLASMKLAAAAASRSDFPPFEKKQLQQKQQLHQQQQSMNGLLGLLLLFVISVCGTMGAIFVMSALTVIETLQTRGNCYLVSVAMSQLIVTLFVVPSSALQIMAGEQGLSAQTVCHYQWLALEYSLLVGQLSFGLIALDNYLGYSCSERVVTKLSSSSSLSPPPPPSPSPLPPSQASSSLARSPEAQNAKLDSKTDKTKSDTRQAERARLLQQEFFRVSSKGGQTPEAEVARSKSRRRQQRGRQSTSAAQMSAAETVGPKERWQPQQRRARLGLLINLGRPLADCAPACLAGNWFTFVARRSSPAESACCPESVSKIGFRLAQQFAGDHSGAQLERPGGCLAYRACCGRLRVLLWILLTWTISLAYVSREPSFGAGFCATPAWSPPPPPQPVLQDLKSALSRGPSGARADSPTSASNQANTAAGPPLEASGVRRTRSAERLIKSLPPAEARARVAGRPIEVGGRAKGNARGPSTRCPPCASSTKPPAAVAVSTVGVSRLAGWATRAQEEDERRKGDKQVARATLVRSAAEIGPAALGSTMGRDGGQVHESARVTRDIIAKASGASSSLSSRRRRRRFHNQARLVPGKRDGPSEGLERANHVGRRSRGGPIAPGRPDSGAQAESLAPGPSLAIGQTSGARNIESANKESHNNGQVVAPLGGRRRRSCHRNSLRCRKRRRKSDDKANDEGNKFAKRNFALAIRGQLGRASPGEQSLAQRRPAPVQWSEARAAVWPFAGANQLEAAHLPRRNLMNNERKQLNNQMETRMGNNLIRAQRELSSVGKRAALGQQQARAGANQLVARVVALESEPAGNRTEAAAAAAITSTTGAEPATGPPGGESWRSSAWLAGAFALGLLLTNLASVTLFARAYFRMKEFKLRPYKPVPVASLALTPPGLLTPRSPIPLIAQRQVYTFEGAAGSSSASQAAAPNWPGSSGGRGSSPVAASGRLEASRAAAAAAGRREQDEGEVEAPADKDEDHEEEDPGELLARAANEMARRVSSAQSSAAKSPALASKQKVRAFECEPTSQQQQQQQQQQLEPRRRRLHSCRQTLHSHVAQAESLPITNNHVGDQFVQQQQLSISLKHHCPQYANSALASCSAPPSAGLAETAPEVLACCPQQGAARYWNQRHSSPVFERRQRRAFQRWASGERASPGSGRRQHAQSFHYGQAAPAACGGGGGETLLARQASAPLTDGGGQLSVTSGRRTRVTDARQATPVHSRATAAALANVIKSAESNWAPSLGQTNEPDGQARAPPTDGARRPRRRPSPLGPIAGPAADALAVRGPELGAQTRGQAPAKLSSDHQAAGRQRRANKVILCTYNYMTDDQLLKSNMLAFAINFLLWLPFVALTLMLHWAQVWPAPSGGSQPTAQFKQLVWWLATLNCCSSSYLYALSNRDFREAFNKLFYYCCCRSHVTFQRKTPIFRRQLDMDSRGNLRVHIFPGMNACSSKPAATLGPGESCSAAFGMQANGAMFGPGQQLGHLQHGAHRLLLANTANLY